MSAPQSRAPSPRSTSRRASSSGSESSAPGNRRVCRSNICVTSWRAPTSVYGGGRRRRSRVIAGANHDRRPDRRCGAGHTDHARNPDVVAAAGGHMKIETFELERNQSLWENEVAINLTESGLHPWSLQEVLTPQEVQELLALPLGYGFTNGDPKLRALIARSYGLTPDNILITN